MLKSIPLTTGEMRTTLMGHVITAILTVCPTIIIIITLAANNFSLSGPVAEGCQHACCISQIQEPNEHPTM